MAIFTKPLSTNTRRWYDLDLDFTAHPVTKDIVLKKDVEAVKRSVRNLILTNPHERPFHPEIGSHIYSHLVENITVDTTVSIRTTIEDVINTYEPRVILLDVRVDGNPDQNLYDITIVFRLINEPDPITVEFFIERLG